MSADLPTSPRLDGPAPDVSVVIPSHGRPEFIRRAVQTALCQTGVSVEVIVVDDGSEVPVRAVLPPSPLVTVLRHESSLGVSIARNHGVEQARGKWVAFLDDDDLWAPDKLAKQVMHMEEHGYRWSHTGAITFDGAMQVAHATPPGKASETTQAMLRALNVVTTPSSVVAEASLLRRAGGFDPTLAIMADWDLWIRLVSLAPAAYLPEHLIGYVTHEGSMHRVRARQLVSEYHRIKVKHRVDGPIGGPIVWRWIAQTYRHTGRAYLAALATLASACLEPAGAWRQRHEFARRARPLLLRSVKRAPSVPQRPMWATPLANPAAATSADAPPSAPAEVQPFPGESARLPGPNELTDGGGAQAA